MSERNAKMGPIGGTLVRLLVERHGRSRSAVERRSAYGLLEGYLSVVLNTLLFGLKLVVGLMSGSVALLADAVHTLADSITSVVVIVASYVGRRPPDEKHPYGHGRVEGVATVMVAVLLGVAAVEFGKESVIRILEPAPVDAPWWMVGLVLGTAVIKEWLARFAGALGRLSGNQALVADAWHHRSDVAATVLVAVSMVASRYGLHWLDGWMGVAVSLVLLKVALDIVRSGSDSLLGVAPSREEILELKQAALAVDGVRGVHDIVVHRYGEVRFVSLHIETSHRASPSALHAVAEEVEEAVGGGQHGSVCVHVDPVNAEHPHYEQVRSLIADVVEEDRRLHSFHDLRLLDRGQGYVVVFDLNVSPECSDRDDELSARQHLAAKVRRETDAVEVHIEVEPLYSYQL